MKMYHILRKKMPCAGHVGVPVYIHATLFAVCIQLLNYPFSKRFRMPSQGRMPKKSMAPHPAPRTMPELATASSRPLEHAQLPSATSAPVKHLQSGNRPNRHAKDVQSQVTMGGPPLNRLLASRKQALPLQRQPDSQTILKLTSHPEVSNPHPPVWSSEEDEEEDNASTKTSASKSKSTRSIRFEVSRESGFSMGGSVWLRSMNLEGAGCWTFAMGLNGNTGNAVQGLWLK